MRLRVLSLNAWGLPWPIGTDVAARTAAIGSALPSLGVDVAAFQEVWTAAMRDALVSAGRAAGLPHAWHHGGARGGGLVVLSRLPLGRSRFETFELRGLAENLHHGDYHGGKGFALLTLESDAGELRFVDTHLHAAYATRANDGYVGHRIGQTVQIAAALREATSPLVAVGDFNFADTSEEYAVLTGIADLVDTARRLGEATDTVLATNPYRAGRRRARGERIDYVFARSGRDTGVTPVSVSRVLDGPLEIHGRSATYSDHAGVLAELELGGPGAPLRAVEPAALELARRLLERARDSAAGRRRTQRTEGALGLASAPLAWAVSRAAPVSRRRVLRGVASSAALLLGLGGAASLFRAEALRSEELRAFDAALARLDRLGAAT